MRAVALVFLFAPALLASDPVARLDSDDWEVQRKAFEEIRALPPEERVPLWARVIREVKNPGWRHSACGDLAMIGRPAAAAALPEIGLALFDEDMHVELQAFQAVQRLGSAAWPLLGLVRERESEPGVLVHHVEQALDAIGRPDAAAPDPWAEADWRRAGDAAGRWARAAPNR